jgi:hypothetical protein
MTTAQEVLADAIPPFPFFIENPVDLNRGDLPTNNATNSPTQPRDAQASAANVYLQDELRGANKDTDPLPDRCQFTFSDGRQCTMGRSEIHPSLCRFHAEREDQLFGDPAPGGNVVGRALDLPELYSACRDLTTASGVNRALAQVFRLLAQRRISRQEAATFGHLAQLLLRSISAARAESTADSSHESPAANVYQSRRNVYQQDELSPQHKVELRGVNKDHQELSRVNNVEPERETSPQPPACRRQEGGISGISHNQHVQTIDSNSCTMNTSEIEELKPVQNEHLHNNGGGGAFVAAAFRPASLVLSASVNPSEYPLQRELKLPGILSTGNYPKIGGA